MNSMSIVQIVSIWCHHLVSMGVKRRGLGNVNDSHATFKCKQVPINANATFRANIRFMCASDQTHHFLSMNLPLPVQYLYFSRA